MMVFGKRGGASTAWVIGIAIAVVALIVLAFAAGGDKSEAEEEKVKNLVKIFDGSEGNTAENAKVKLERLGDKEGFVYRSITFIFQYILGMHKGVLESLGVGAGSDGELSEGEASELGDLSIRGLMILIAVWVIFFLVFTDMAIVFGTFSNKAIGFLVGLAVTIIFANFGLYYWLIIWLMGIFAFAAGLSVVLAMFSILILAVGAHFGAGWALNAVKTKRAIWDIERGGSKIVGGAKVLKKVGEAAED